MPENDFEFNPTEILILAAIGKPGERTFFLRGGSRNFTVTLRIEKIQIQMLALGVREFLAALKNKYPYLDDQEAVFDEHRMILEPPIDPLFQVAGMRMGYDSQKDLIVIIFESAERPGGPEEGSKVVRFWCKRGEAAGLAAWADELASRGRQTPDIIDRVQGGDGFSPRNNGHKH